MQVDSGEHRRGLECMRLFVAHVDKEASSLTTGVAPSPLQLVTVGAPALSNQNASGFVVSDNATPTGVSCKSPRCASNMIVNVAGKCPESVLRERDRAQAEAATADDDLLGVDATVQQDQPVTKSKKKPNKRNKHNGNRKGGSSDSRKPGKDSMQKTKGKKERGTSTKVGTGLPKKKKRSHKDEGLPKRMPIRLMMKRKRQEIEIQKQDNVGGAKKGCKRQPEPSVTTMITTSMITSSFITSSTSDPTLRVVVARPKAVKPKPPPPPPPVAKRKKPPPPPYPPPK